MGARKVQPGAVCRSPRGLLSRPLQFIPGRALRFASAQGARGFSLIELLIVVAIILIVAAIAIPNFMRSRMSANETAAVAACKKILTAQVAYSTTFGGGFSERLEQLGPPPAGSPVSPDRAGLLDEILVSGTKHGYIFTYTSYDNNGDGQFEAFDLLAVPTAYNVTGVRSFFINNSGVVRATGENRPATENDPPIG
jgi:type IV pilus assembly protein PilA